MNLSLHCVVSREVPAADSPLRGRDPAAQEAPGCSALAVLSLRVPIPTAYLHDSGGTCDMAAYLTGREQFHCSKRWKGQKPDSVFTVSLC